MNTPISNLTKEQIEKPSIPFTVEELKSLGFEQNKKHINFYFKQVSLRLYQGDICNFISISIEEDNYVTIAFTTDRTQYLVAFQGKLLYFEDFERMFFNFFFKERDQKIYKELITYRD